MARTAGVAKSSVRPTRQARAAAKVAFENEEDEIVDSEDDGEGRTATHAPGDSENDDGGPSSELDDDGNDMLTLLKEFKKRKAKQASARTAEFQAEKKAIYTAGRKHALEVSQAGIAYIADARSRIKEEFKAQETSPERHFKDMIRHMEVQDASANSITAIYSTFFDDLVPHRVEQIDSIHAACMLSSLSTDAFLV